MARNTLCKKSVNVEAGVVTFTFADETTKVFEAAQVNDALMQQAMLHGFSQKLGDSYAGALNVTEAKQRFQDVLDSLYAGTWNAGRSSDGGVWVEALSRATGATLEEAREKWNSLDDDTRKTLRAHPKVKAEKLAIDLERAQAKAEGDSDIDLDELME